MAPDSTVQDLDRLYQQARTAKARLEPVWYLNLAYYEGAQWLAFGGGRLFQPQMPRSKITIVDNRIQPCVRTEIAKMTKNRPVFTVTPQSADQEDANSSELAEQVMRYLWKHLNMQELTVKALHWSRICGAGFLKAFWDPSIGDSVEVLMDPAGQNPLSGPAGGPIRSGTPEATMAHQMAATQGQQLVVKRIAQGDLRCEVRSPFQMFVDPLADTFEEAEWVIEESIKSTEYVLRRYGREVEADTTANPGLIEARMGQSLTTQSGGGYKGVKIREYWCKPNSNYPQGCRTVWIGGAEKGQKGPKAQILATDGRPFDPMPYVMISGIPVPGRLWPTSICEQLRGPQTELNKVKSQIAENRNRLGNPTLLYSRTAVRNFEELNTAISQPGGMLGYDDVGSPNPQPSYLAPPPLQEYVLDEIQRIEESIQEISGQHEVTSAQVPPGVTAASAINLLQEADNTRLGPAITDYEIQLGKFGQKLLKLVARYYDDTRTIRLGGDNGAWQIFDFRGSMLRNNTAVEVQAGSSFPQSQAAKQAQMQDMLTYSAQSGQPIQGRKLAQFYQDWGMGAMSKFVADFAVSETQCNRENALLLQGQQLPTNEYDDDEAHIANHEDFQRQPRYAQEIQRNPQVGQIFEAHVAAHRQKLAMIQQQQTQMQLQAQGQDPAAQQQQAQQQQAQQAQQAQMQAAQGQQQMDLKGAQGAQQQGLSEAQAAQQQQHAEDLHAQKLRHAEEAHQVRMRQQAQTQRQGAQHK